MRECNVSEREMTTREDGRACCRRGIVCISERDARIIRRAVCISEACMTECVEEKRETHILTHQCIGTILADI